MIAEILSVAQAAIPAALSAAQSGGFDISQALGIKPKGSGDTQYARDVAEERQREYDAAYKGIQAVGGNQSLAQKIVDLYNKESAAWGDPNNPSRNVARPDQLYAGINEVISNYTGSIPPSTQNSTPATPYAATNSSFLPGQTTGADASNTYLNTKPQEINMPMIAGFAAIGVILVIVLMKGKM